MKNGLVTKAAQAAMAMNDLNLFANDDIPQYGKEGEDGGHGRLTIDDEEWDMIDLKPIGEISYSGAAFVRMSDDDDLVPAIYEFLGSKINQQIATSTYIRIYSRLIIDKCDFPLLLRRRLDASR